MKTILLVAAIGFFNANVFSQTETFDIASYVPPKGWERVVSKGILLFQNMKTNNGQSMFCNIFLYPSRAAGVDPVKNFEAEWNDKVARPTRAREKPKIKTGTTEDGWTVVTGLATITHKAITFTCILVSATGSGRLISVLVNVAGEDYMSDVQDFLNTLELNANAPATSNR
jgi:hypothetical protein